MGHRVRPNRTTPCVRRMFLTIPSDAGNVTIRLDSAKWRSWLTTATHFYVDHAYGGFACRKQRAQRGNPYWIGYCRVRNVVYRTYIGTNDAVTLAAIDESAAQLVRKRVQWEISHLKVSVFDSDLPTA